MSPRISPHGECPSSGQWNDLLAHRYEADRDQPEGWGWALAHMEQCASCRKTAVGLDPTLLFRRLTAPAPALEPAAEVAAMQQAVAAMRRADRVERTEQRSHGGMWTSGGRWVAAAAVALSTLSLGASLWNDGLWQKGPGGEGSLAAGLGAVPSSLDLVLDAVGEMPAIESFGTPQSASDEGPMIWESEGMPAFEPFGIPESASVEGPMIWESEVATLIMLPGSEELQGV